MIKEHTEIIVLKEKTISKIKSSSETSTRTNDRNTVHTTTKNEEMMVIINTNPMINNIINENQITRVAQVNFINNRYTILITIEFSTSGSEITLDLSSLKKLIFILSQFDCISILEVYRVTRL